MTAVQINAVQVGDIVTLKSGGPTMTVVRVRDSSWGVSFGAPSLDMECKWFSEDGTIHSDMFSISTVAVETSRS